MNVGTTTSGGGECVGGIFDLGQVAVTGSGHGPSWIIGDTFLVRRYKPLFE
jgi:hypothetical protein